ncbi:MAG: hypothetical protein K0R59_4276, partial [Sphingobacterium sp.]|nr:hypothetical protein [Sphingobacterium sp.]MDF2518980.1 hypothetical protein [Sphingobacterium sp.]
MANFTQELKTIRIMKEITSKFDKVLNASAE